MWHRKSFWYRVWLDWLWFVPWPNKRAAMFGRQLGKELDERARRRKAK